ncbi:MAG: hypothetical protein AB7T14_10170 [Candidatus Methylacidiphilaceae bacterium]
MRKMWIICLAMLSGTGAEAYPPPIHPEMPPATRPAAPREKLPGTGSTANGESAPRSPLTAPVIPPEPQPSNPSNPGSEEAIGSTAEEVQSPETGVPGVTLDFRTRELMELKRIAHELGGNLVISIEPRGISPADLIVPLKSSGFFEVSAKDEKTFLVTSSGEGQKRELEREIAALARRQAALLRNIEVLEAMRAEGRIPETKDGEGKGGKPNVAEQEAPPMSPPGAGSTEYPLPGR